MKKFLAIAGLLTTSINLHAEVAVIVHPSNSSTLDQNQIKRIFVGKMKSFPVGGEIIPIKQKSNVTPSDEFNTKVLKKSASQLKAYWSKLIFTGKGVPPREVSNDEEVIKLISANPNTIGYIDAAKVDSTVKVIAKF